MATDNEMLEELKKITALLTPKPASPPPKGFVNEFKSFLSQYRVLGLAVAFILGLYLGQLVQALVSDLIMPIIQYTQPKGVTWNTIAVGPFEIGAFCGAVLTFVIVALVIFLIVKIAANASKGKVK
jgi:large conductance mechanosensitive channel